MNALIVAAAVIACPFCDRVETRTVTRYRVRTRVVYVAPPPVVEVVEVPAPAPRAAIQQGLDDQAVGENVDIRVRTRRGRTTKVDVKNHTTGSKYRYRSH